VNAAGGAIPAVMIVVLAVVAARLMIGAARPRRALRSRPPAWATEAPVGASEADRRSRDLLRSVINDDEWAMFSELGFLCVTGRRLREDGRLASPRYRYLIYPHLPLVALLPRSMAPVREYCVQFPERDRHGGVGDDLPIGDDVLAKWMTVRANEDRLLAFANVSNAGCQIPLSQIERDLRRLSRWQALHGPIDPVEPAISARY
jgi:hypothetical protein